MASRLMWSESFNIGIASIDAQHKKLFSLLVDFQEAVEMGASHEVLTKICEELFIFSEAHFENEESLFKKYGYPDEKAHLKEHEALKEQAMQHFRSTNNTYMSSKEIEFLRSWLLKHILEVDKLYVPFLQSKNVK